MSPTVELRGQVLDHLRSVAGEVSGLADVTAEIVQLTPASLGKLDHFELPGPDRPARTAALVAVMREMPVQGVAIDRLAAKQRSEVDPIRLRVQLHAA